MLLTLFKVSCFSDSFKFSLLTTVISPSSPLHCRTSLSLHLSVPIPVSFTFSLYLSFYFSLSFSQSLSHYHSLHLFLSHSHHIHVSISIFLLFFFSHSSIVCVNLSHNLNHHLSLTSVQTGFETRCPMRT